MSSIKERLEAMKRKKAEAAAAGGGGGSQSGPNSGLPSSLLATPASALPGSALVASLDSNRIQDVVQLPATAPASAPAPADASDASAAVAAEAAAPAHVATEVPAAREPTTPKPAPAPTTPRVAMPVVAHLEDPSRRTPGPAVYSRDPPLPRRSTSMQLARAFLAKPSKREKKNIAPAPDAASATDGDTGNTKRRSRSAEQQEDQPPVAAARTEEAGAVAADAKPTPNTTSRARQIPADGTVRPTVLPGRKGCRPSADFRAGARISEGVYGVVCKATERATNAPLAMKWLREKWFAESRVGFPDYLLREIDLLHRMQHPKVLGATCIATEHRTEAEVNAAHVANGGPPGPLVSKGSQSTRIFVITDYAGCNLRTEIYRASEPLPLPAIKDLSKQLLQGIDFMHRNGIMHRDLKPSNVLVDANCDVQLCDMGLARGLRPRERDLTLAVITLMYRPPELHFGVRDYATDVDIWSFGCILAEMFIRDPLFPALEDPEHFRVVCEVMGCPDDRVWPDLMKLRGARRILRDTTVKVDSTDAAASYNLEATLPKIAGAPRACCCKMPSGGRSCTRLKAHLRSKRPDIFGGGDAATVEDAESLIDLIDRLLQWNPRYRPTSDEALTHPFFAAGLPASCEEVQKRRHDYEEAHAKRRAAHRARLAERAGAVDGAPAATAADAAASGVDAAVPAEEEEEDDGGDAMLATIDGVRDEGGVAHNVAGAGEVTAAATREPSAAPAGAGLVV